MPVSVYNGPEAEWDGFVASMPGATAYHQLKWRDVFARSFGHEPVYLAARDASGRIAGVLPLVSMRSRLFGRFLVSLPFVNYGGVLSGSPEATAELLAEAGRRMGDLGARHVELRHLGAGLDGVPARQHKVTMLLDLAEDAEAQWTGFNAKLRNQVRKAMKSNLETRTGGIELLDGFYEVFARNMRDLGTPVYAKTFFRNVLETFADSSRLLAVTLDGRTIAAGLALWHRGTIEVPWASSNKDHKALCPNNLLYWEAIRFAIAGGFRTFDFGRSTPGEGTFKFKEQWGAKPRQLFWQYLLPGGGHLPDLNPKNPKYALAIKAWQRLPVPVTKLLGPMIVRGIP